MDVVTWSLSEQVTRSLQQQLEIVSQLQNTGQKIIKLCIKSLIRFINIGKCFHQRL